MGIKWCLLLCHLSQLTCRRLAHLDNRTRQLDITMLTVTMCVHAYWVATGVCLWNLPLSESEKPYGQIRHWCCHWGSNPVLTTLLLSQVSIDSNSIIFSQCPTSLTIDSKPISRNLISLIWWKHYIKFAKYQNYNCHIRCFERGNCHDDKHTLFTTKNPEKLWPCCLVSFPLMELTMWHFLAFAVWR